MKRLLRRTLVLQKAAQLLFYFIKTSHYFFLLKMHKQKMFQNPFNAKRVLKHFQFDL